MGFVVAEKEGWADGGLYGASELFNAPVLLLQQVDQSVHDGACRIKQAVTNIRRHRDGTTAAGDARCQVLELALQACQLQPGQTDSIHVNIGFISDSGQKRGCTHVMSCIALQLCTCRSEPQLRVPTRDPNARLAAHVSIPALLQVLHLYEVQQGFVRRSAVSPDSHNHAIASRRRTALGQRGC